MHTISKEFHFSASHALLGLPVDHPCSALHGHNYIIRVFFRGPVNEKGFVIDYNDLKPIGKWIDEYLDHTHLNHFFPFSTTVENMTEYIFNHFKPTFPTLYAVEMSETPKTTCRYEAD